MFDLRQPVEFCAAAPQNFRQASYPVKIRMSQKNPFRVGLLGGEPAKPDTDVFAKLFRRFKPRQKCVIRFCCHNSHMHWEFMCDGSY